MQPVFVPESRTRALQRLPGLFDTDFSTSSLRGTLNGLEEEDFQRPGCSSCFMTCMSNNKAGQNFRARLCETSFEKLRKRSEPV